MTFAQTTLAETLNSLLATSGLTAAEVARRAGMGQYGPQQLQRLLDGTNNNPHYWTLRTIVEAMGGKLIILRPSKPEPGAWDSRAIDGSRRGRPPRWANPAPSLDGGTEISSDAT
jgi:DNA-binding phage protein